MAFAHKPVDQVDLVERPKVFVAGWWRHLLYILVLYLPAIGIGVFGLSALRQQSTFSRPMSDKILLAVIMLVGFGLFLLWLALLGEKIEVTATSLVRTSILGRKSIFLSEILNARCGIQGRGNTLLVVETRHGRRRRMGMSLPTKKIEELADLVNSRVNPGTAGQASRISA